MKKLLFILWFAPRVLFAGFGPNQALKLANATSAAAVASFGCDNFTDTNGTLLTAHTPSGTGCSGTWTVETGSSGNGEIQTNSLEDQNGDAPTLYHSGTPATAEYDVQATITGAGDTGGPAGRCSAIAATFYYAYWANGSNEWRLTRSVATVQTTLATAVTDDPNGSVRTVKLQIRDAAKKVFIGGVERITSADNTITAAGSAGWTGSGVTSDDTDDWIASNP